MNVEDEMRRVYCRVYDTGTTSRLLVNHEVCKKLTKQAIKRIKGYGLSCVEEPPGERGGGGPGELWDIIKALWDAKDVIGIILSVSRTVVGWIRRPSETYVPRSKPTLVIFLAVRKKSPKGEWYGDVSDVLLDLKHLADDVCSWLKEQYPIYSFDQQMKLSLYAESYRVGVYQKSNKMNTFNNGRLLRRLGALRQRNNLDVNISFSRYVFLKQSVYPVTCYGIGWMSESKHKNYYTIISSRLITKYPPLGPSRIQAIARSLMARLSPKVNTADK